MDCKLWNVIVVYYIVLTIQLFGYEKWSVTGDFKIMFNTKHVENYCYQYHAIIHLHYISLILMALHLVFMRTYLALYLYYVPSTLYLDIYTKKVFDVKSMAQRNKLSLYELSKHLLKLISLNEHHLTFLNQNLSPNFNDPPLKILFSSHGAFKSFTIPFLVFS